MLVFLTEVFTTLPKATLAAVVIVAVSGLVDIPSLRHLYEVSRSEFAIAMGALVGVLFFGMLPGVLLSLLVTIGRISESHTM